MSFPFVLRLWAGHRRYSPLWWAERTIACWPGEIKHLPTRPVRYRVRWIEFVPRAEFCCRCRR